jgi:hypothetical protein
MPLRQREEIQKVLRQVRGQIGGEERQGER